MKIGQMPLILALSYAAETLTVRQDYDAALLLTYIMANYRSFEYLVLSRLLLESDPNIPESGTIQ